MFEVGGTKIEQVPTMGDEGSKFWDFCENVIIDCPPLENLEMDSVSYSSMLSLGHLVSQISDEGNKGLFFPTRYFNL